MVYNRVSSITLIIFHFRFIEHMGCENSQLIQNIPNQKAIEKAAMLFDQIVLPREEKQNKQNVGASLRQEGSKTVRKEKQLATLGSRKVNALSKFAVPRSKQLPDLSMEKMENRQLSKEKENQTASTVYTVKAENLLAGFVVDDGAYKQKDAQNILYENCQGQCISEEIKSEQLGTQALQVFEPSESQNYQQQDENKVEKQEVECYPSSFLRNEPFVNPNIGVQEQSELSNEHSIASSRSCEPLIIILTQTGEAMTHEY